LKKNLLVLEYPFHSGKNGLLEEDNNLGDTKMKRMMLLFGLGLVLLFPAKEIKAENFAVTSKIEYSDSLSPMAIFSLFYSYYTNKDYKSSLPYGWQIVETDPKPFLKYHPFTKMADMLWYQHDSVATTQPEKEQLADTLLYLLNIGMRYISDSTKLSDFNKMEGVIFETWYETPEIDSAVSHYEKALALNPSLEDYYKDRLGLLYIKLSTDDESYKMKALELYSKMSEQDPSNPTWVSRIEGLAENIDELIDITKKAWDLEKNNTEKAWKYASLCIKAEEYEKAIEPLQFLIEKSPEVVNYRVQLARAYTKLEEFSKALKEYKQLIKLDPKNRDYYVNTAIIYKDMDQLSVARSYLEKAMKVDPTWDYPHYILGTIYEQSARSCKFDFDAKIVYLLASTEYRKAVNLKGTYASVAAERISALKDSVPQKEDYFFRKLKSGDKVKVKGSCFGWIKRTVIVP